MVRRVSLWLAVSAVLGATAPARAHDRLRHARTIFTTKCGGCHLDSADLGRELPRDKINLAASVKSWSDAALRAWIKSPQKVKANSSCDAGSADPVQADLVIALLRARPHSTSATPLIPPYTPGPPQPEHAVDPHAGQGDHR